MSEMTVKTGYFVFSLDTELAWGYHDCDELRRIRFSRDGTRERQSIARMLDVLDAYGIAATWACVGHLFHEKCEDCSTCRIAGWKGRHRSFDEAYRTNHPLWYGADVIDMLVARKTRHEIAFHGYTHEVFDETRMDKETAEAEIREWLRVAQRRKIVPRTVVFPRNAVGHLDLFEKFGFLCYRGAEDASGAGAFSPLEKLRRRLRQAPFLFMPPVYDVPSAGPRGLVNIPSSPNYFKHGGSLRRLFLSLQLTKLSMSGATRAVKRAAREGRVVHVWSHPCEFQTAGDWKRLRHLFDCVREQASQGRMESITMADLARKALS